MSFSQFLHLARSTSKDLFIWLVALAIITPLLSLVTGPGINEQFLAQVWIALLPAAGLCLLGHLILRRFEFDEPEPKQASSRLELIYVLLPLTPIVQYILLNQDILDWHGSVLIFSLFASLSFVLIYLLPNLLSRWISRSVSVSVLLSLLFIILYMPILALEHSWHLKGNGTLQVSILFGLIGAIWVFIQLNLKLLMVVIVSFFASNTLVVGLGMMNNVTTTQNEPHPIEVKTSPKLRPNIYMLTYDSYVDNETFLSHGIDNSAQEEYLEQLGFTIYRGTYSLGGNTRLSMGSVLGLSDFAGAAGGKGKVVTLLKTLGYETHGIFRDDYLFQDGGANYDNTFPGDSSLATHWILIRAIFEGEFRFDAFYDKPSRKDFLQEKQAALSKDGNRPQFVYTHTGPDHSQNSGQCLSNEVDLFEQRLQIANAEMRNDLSTIASSHPNSVIIVNGDHGPYLTKNCTLITEDAFSLESITRQDIQDRFGAFLAIRWPTNAPVHDDVDITVLQDIFPNVLSYLFQDNSFLELKLEPTTFPQETRRVAGARIENGIIRGGQHDGEPLYSTHNRAPQ